MHLNAQQHGAYLLLLMHSWCNGPLPNDDRQLAAIARLDVPTWQRRVAPVVRPFFHEGEGGSVLTQGRLERERERVKGISDRRAASGRKGAEVSRGGMANGVANGVANGQQTSGKRTGKSPVSHNSQLESKNGSYATDAPSASGPVPRDVRKALWDEGVPILRRLVGKSETQTRGLLGRLLRDAKDDCAVMLATLRDAEDLRPIDPVAWLTEAARDRGIKTGSLQRIADEWNLLSIDELDANAARLMKTAGNA